ncbi:hypothetical protein LDENG_00098130 [Lucifuga dentata]|nr:hypothetical protein LDENG_00098130 [Lucifuga dentata]
MAVFFRSGNREEIGEYQEFPKNEAETVVPQTTSRHSDSRVEIGEYQKFPKNEAEAAVSHTSPRTKFRHISVVLLSFGLLCVLQAVLNISLRLVLKAEEKEKFCPRTWLSFGSSCYFISSQRRSWNYSRQDCLQRDADLVIINSRQEHAFLTGFTKAAWIGMTDRAQERTWKWVDGTTVSLDSEEWATGQPDNAFGGEDCGEIRTMNNFLGWNDLNCRATIPWICEKTL